MPAPEAEGVAAPTPKVVPTFPVPVALSVPVTATPVSEASNATTGVPAVFTRSLMCPLVLL